MGKFAQGQLVVLKSDKSVKGAIMQVIAGTPETRYQVFTASGPQIYYESQIEIEIDASVELEAVDAERFNAGLTASLIRNPSLSSLYSLNAAKIDYIPHQFRPVLKFIRSDRPRILIADGVGVGKTIEAGLILREMQARMNLESVLIICPRPLVAERKWESEMKRFDEEFTALDGESFRYCIKEMDMEGDWPDKYKKCIIPYSLFDDSNINGSNNGSRARLGLTEVDPPKFDLVIVDEAHHIRNTATFGYKAVEYFVDCAEAVVFLTATPVQLEQDDLFVLLNLLRPELIIDRNTFHDMAEPNQYINAAAIAARGMKDGWQQEAFDNIKMACATSWGQKVFTGNPIIKRIVHTLLSEEISAEDRVQLITDIENSHTFSNIISRTRRRDIGEFTVRKPFTRSIEFTPAQKQLHDGILDIIHQIFSAIYCTDNTKFMMTTIRRQTASCLFGLVPMLNDILYKHVYELVDDGEDYGISMDKEKDAKTIIEKIKDIIELAENLPEDDPKLEDMLKIVDAKMASDKPKVMIFSSFKHTLNYIYKKLTERGYRVGLIHGDVPDDERRSLRERFNPNQTPSEDPSAIDVLLFSEVGCEGLDYQFCDCMINYDLPWNPMRVEQRIGRIDRNGQTSESVSIYNLITPGTVDADIYDRCLMRIGVFHSSVGDCEDILGDLTSEIKRIAEDFELTDEERRAKLQQLTDNKVRYIKEQEELEEKQRDLFGINMPQNAFDEEVKDATNYWLSAENIQNLVSVYLKNRTGEDKDYFLGDKELKTLRLSKEARQLLLDDFKASKLKRSETTRTWEKWLKSGEQHIQITFDNNCSKENPRVMFINITHPLVKQAADYLQSKGKVVSTLKTKTNAVAPGVYPFAIFQWKLSGDREDIQMKPISANDELNKVIFDLLKNSTQATLDVNMTEHDWEAVETVHHQIWEEALEEHKSKTREMILYKESSLKTSHNARMASLEESLHKSSNATRRMLQEGKIKRAVDDFEYHMTKLEEAKEKADILFELLSYGLLEIEAE